MYATIFWTYAKQILLSLYCTCARSPILQIGLPLHKSLLSPPVNVNTGEEKEPKVSGGSNEK